MPFSQAFPCLKNMGIFVIYAAENTKTYVQVLYPVLKICDNILSKTN